MGNIVIASRRGRRSNLRQIKQDCFVALCAPRNDTSKMLCCFIDLLVQKSWR